MNFLHKFLYSSKIECTINLGIFFLKKKKDFYNQRKSHAPKHRAYNPF